MHFSLKFCRSGTPDLPGSLLLQTTQAQEKSRWAVVAVQCGVSQHSNQFLVPGHMEYRGRWVLSRVSLSLFLSVVMLPHHSGQIPETTVFYYKPAKYRERWVYTLWKQVQDWTDPRSWRTSLDPSWIRVNRKFLRNKNYFLDNLLSKSKSNYRFLKAFFVYSTLLHVYIPTLLSSSAPPAA